MAWNSMNRKRVDRQQRKRRERLRREKAKADAADDAFLAFVQTWPQVLESVARAAIAMVEAIPQAMAAFSECLHRATVSIGGGPPMPIVAWDPGSPEGDYTSAVGLIGGEITMTGTWTEGSPTFDYDALVASMAKLGIVSPQPPEKTTTPDELRRLYGCPGDGASAARFNSEGGIV